MFTTHCNEKKKKKNVSSHYYSCPKTDHKYRVKLAESASYILQIVIVHILQTNALFLEVRAVLQEVFNVGFGGYILFPKFR